MLTQGGYRLPKYGTEEILPLLRRKAFCTPPALEFRFSNFSGRLQVSVSGRDVGRVEDPTLVRSEA